ncbi:MAG: ATPase [Nitrospirales bacterium]|nr:MAG: ATPase [Nitrospirales bacterium]
MTTTGMSKVEVWQQDNKAHLGQAIGEVREILIQHSKLREQIPSEVTGRLGANLIAPTEAVNQKIEQTSSMALEKLCHLFGLSSFERATLLLCVGVELEPTIAGLCAESQGTLQQGVPNFGLALAAFPNAHWSAVTPGGPLRHWRLIELGSGQSLITRPLRIDERILHYLTGLSQLDERLTGMVEPVTGQPSLCVSHQQVADQIVRLWSYENTRLMRPVIQLTGDCMMEKRAAALTACHALGLKLGFMSADAIPTNIIELDSFIRLWEREVVLTGCALYLDCGELDVLDHGRMAVVTRMFDRCRGFLFVGNRERRQIGIRPAITLEVNKPNIPEQRHEWQMALGESAAQLNGQLDHVVSQFHLGSQSIRTAAQDALGRVNETHGRALDHELWEACRAQARPRLDDLGQRLESGSGWDDLVLPRSQKYILRDIAAQTRQRATVYERWGFGGKGGRGLGITVLFAGASGTGKTMAAEVLANELHLDVYRIDLSAMVSKYIGETEKNLRRVFDAAEEGGVILLFDEADALFGKRSEVQDSHDRYANIEVSYLLQRMESYQGLAILTTNLKSALDQAFLRRLRFIVQFPFPDTAQRTEMWRRVFPEQTPTDELEAGKLAQLNVAGGNIKSIALNAAFLAANDGQSVGMRHVLAAAQSEYDKLQKPLTDVEIKGWVVC